MFTLLIIIFAIFAGASLLLALFMAIDGVYKMALMFLVTGILSIVAIVSLSQISKNDLENNFNNQSRHITVITQIKSVSEDEVVLSNSERYFVSRMPDRSILKNINIGDVVEVVYFKTKMDDSYIYSIKKLKVTYGK